MHQHICIEHEQFGTWRQFCNYGYRFAVWHVLYSC
jgi:hypothetical protein